MRLDLAKPEAVWCSFNESCGVGDGKTKEFKTPLPVDARSVVVMRDFAMVSPDNRLIEKNDMDGSILKEEDDGYKLETRNENELWVAFDRAPAFQSKISVGALGRKVGDSFAIFPMTTKLQKKIEEEQPESMRKRDPKKVSLLDLQEYGKLTFNLLVADWSGVDAEFNDANKKLFLEQYNPMVMGGFAMERSYALRDERMNSFAKDSTD